jgi:hypothetical protein
MPRVSGPITSTPEVPGQPWDATSSATVAGWKSVDSGSGPASMTTGEATGDFESDSGWSQT